ncbi:hypothetical protein N0V90_005949 [Kalmusia sp. IMI 367209]|nr:hypothetical protein N0V90_005949 [Kalmusia sp. IMI 367209]
MDSWKWIVAIFIAINLKNLPLSWHIRFFHALGAGLLLSRKLSCVLKPHHIFVPIVSSFRSPLMELDFNFHKSNSTYFTDLDISRAYLSGALFAPLFLRKAANERCNMIVGAVSCSFRRELKPYQAYEAWTKVVSWDDKWLYMVTHFVEKKKAASPRSVLEFDGSHSSVSAMKLEVNANSERWRNTVIASAVTQFVIKKGRMTVPPAIALRECGLLPDTATHSNASLGPSDSAIMESIESFRSANLPITKLYQGWEPVHRLFTEEYCLGKH